MEEALTLIQSDIIDNAIAYKPLIDAVERALGLFSQSKDKNDPAATTVSQPVRGVVRIPSVNGFLGSMPVYMEADDLLVTKLVSFFPQNKEVPTHHAIVLAFHASTGVPRALLDGKCITKKRTAAASAVATKYLVNGEPKVLALLGSGKQAASHYQALKCLFNFQQVRVWNHRFEGAQAFVSQEEHKHNCVACESAEEAVRDADVIVTVTISSTPVLKAAWVKPGAHINAVGACRPEWAEIDGELMRTARVYVDSTEGALKESGDIILSQATIFAEIGEVINGKKAGLREETTVFKSLGMAVEDAAAVKLVLENLKL